MEIVSLSSCLARIALRESDEGVSFPARPAGRTPLISLTPLKTVIDSGSDY